MVILLIKCHSIWLHLVAVVRIGIPATILMIYIASQLYQDGKKLIKFSNLGPDLAWIAPLSFVIILPILPPRYVNMYLLFGHVFGTFCKCIDQVHNHVHIYSTNCWD